MSLIKCLYPRYVYNKYLCEYVSVPCGQCSVCRSIKSLQWSNRLELECKLHKFVLFGTLTYTDDCLPRISVNDIPDSDTLSLSIEKSLDWIEFNDGFVPYIRMKDFQDFIKRVRIYLERNYGIKQKEHPLRYFVTSEYGPSSFRPHFHYLLFFDYDFTSRVIKECIYQSWKFKNHCSPRKLWFRRNQQRFVIGFSCASYLASYLNCLASVPPLLLEPLLRPKHLQSINPSIGLSRLSLSEVQRLSCMVHPSVSFVRPSSNRVVNVSLWRTFENRYFPRCFHFHKITFCDRVTLYTLADGTRFFKNSEEFAEWVLCKWYTSISLIKLLRFICPTSYCFKGLLTEKEWPKRLWSFSVSFLKLCKSFSVAPSTYLGYITSYYCRKDYFQLYSQIELEQEWSERCPRTDYPLKYLPYIIDSQFYDNRRNLNSFAYKLYLKQFCVDSDPINCLPFNSREFKDVASNFNKIVSDNTKTRVKKDWLSFHPEFANFYTQTFNHL